MRVPGGPLVPLLGARGEPLGLHRGLAEELAWAAVALAVGLAALALTHWGNARD